MNLSGINKDAGISAKYLKGPGVRKILKLAKTKKIDAIVVNRYISCLITIKKVTL